jgi:rieske iron-sulfur protein
MTRDSHGRISTAPCAPGAPVSCARRSILRGTLAAGLGLALLRPAAADDDKPGSDERPQPGDLLVFADGDQAGAVVKPADVKLNEGPVSVWPMDPHSKVVRDGSRLNQALLLHLEPASLGEEMQPYAADGIVAFSAVCTHAGCPVTGWVEDQGRQVLKCFCHNSEYDPRQEAKVVFGPAPRHLAVLPVKIVDGALVVAKGFIGKVGPTQPT